MTGTVVQTMLVLALALAGAGAHGASGFDPSQAPGKLPKDVVPRAYRLHIRPDIHARRLDGEESVRLEFRSATDRVVLNTLDMTLRTYASTGVGSVAGAPTSSSSSPRSGSPRRPPPGRTR